MTHKTTKGCLKWNNAIHLHNTHHERSLVTYFIKYWYTLFLNFIKSYHIKWTLTNSTILISKANTILKHYIYQENHFWVSNKCFSSYEYWTFIFWTLWGTLWHFCPWIFSILRGKNITKCLKEAKKTKVRYPYKEKNLFDTQKCILGQV